MPGTHPLILADLATLIQRTVVGVVVLVTVVLALVWTSVNFYSYYPLVQAQLETAVDRVVPARDGGSATADFVYPLRGADGGASARIDGGDARRPSITVLVPAYEEAGVIRNSLRSIYEASYPPGLLEVLVLVEPDDDGTRAALNDLAATYPFETLVVPAAYPGEPNKPRALDYGFEHADSEVIGVVDAEVIVGEDTFERAAAAVAEGADFALCHLDMVNEDDGWLNLLFRAEYGYWYREVVPAFARVGYPVPLGGTSCFFRRGVLERTSRDRHEAGGPAWSSADRLWLFEHGLDGAIPWDPENITEDFELGLTLWANGYEFAYLDATTREESPLDLQGWMVQRVRWKQGKLYTFRQYVEQRPGTLRQRFHLYWQSLLPHLGPINIAGLVFVVWLANVAGAVPSTLVRWLLALGLAFLVMVGSLYARGYWLVSEKPLATRLRRTAVVALTLYFYWFLQWIADVRAIQLTYHGRFDWESTRHLGRNLLAGQGDGDASGAAADATAAGTSVMRDEEGGERNHADGRDGSVLGRPRSLAALLAVVGTAAAVRIAGLTRWSLWLDEIYTITFRAAVPIREALVVSHDPHPPLYFVLLHLWMDVAGRTRVAAGLFSVAFSVATVVAVYAFARRLYDDRTGLLAAGLVAVSTMHLHFGRNVRMYSLLTFLSVASWYALVRLPDRDRVADAAYLLTTVALLYTHVYALFVLLSQAAYALLTETGTRVQRRWLRLQVLVGLAYAPWAVVLAGQVIGRTAGSGRTAIGWIPAPSIALLRDTLLMYAGFPSFYPILAGSAATWVVAVVVLFVFNVAMLLAVVFYDPDDGAYRLADLDQASLLVIFFAVPIVVPFVASYVLFPVYFPRFALVASLPLYVLVARGLTNLDGYRGWQTAFVAVVVLGAVVTGAGYVGGESVEDWRGAVNGMETDVEPGDLLVIQPFWVERDVAYYYDGATVDRVSLPTSSGMTPDDRQRLATRMDGHDTVWLIRYESEGAAAVETVAAEYRLAVAYDHGRIAILRYERPATPSTRASTPAPCVVSPSPSDPSDCNRGFRRTGG